MGINLLAPLLHPDTWLRAKTMPNRLRLLAEWVAGGGSLIMCGGYYSFAGIYGGAKYYRTPIEHVLPVAIHPFDDRIEMPEGARAEIVLPDHPVVAGISAPWPALLGFNEVVLKSDATLIASVTGHPLLAARDYGKGKSLVWTSDIGPHWCLEPFVTWAGYGQLWLQALKWLTD